jgi:hypothetical protein
MISEQSTIRFVGDYDSKDYSLQNIIFYIMIYRRHG